MKFPELDELQTLAGKGLTAVGDAATSTTGQGLIGAAAQGLMGLGQRNKGPINQFGNMVRTGLLAKYGADQTDLKRKQNLALLANQKATLANQQKTQELAKKRFDSDERLREGKRKWSDDYAWKQGRIAKQNAGVFNKGKMDGPYRNITNQEIKLDELSEFNPNQAAVLTQKQNRKSLFSTEMQEGLREKYGYTRDTLADATPEHITGTRKFLDDQIAKKKVKQYESQYEKEMGKSYAKIAAEVNVKGLKAVSKLENIGRQADLLRNIKSSGQVGEWKMSMMQFARGAGLEGFDTGELGFMEAAEALGTQLALGMKEVGTGPMTDEDFNNFLKTVPNLMKSPEGREMVIQGITARQNRKKAIMNLMTDYMKANNGRIDQAFIMQIAQHSKDNPMFDKKTFKPIDYEKAPIPRDEETAKAVDIGNYTPSPDLTNRMNKYLKVNQ